MICKRPEEGKKAGLRKEGGQAWLGRKRILPGTRRGRRPAILCKEEPQSKFGERPVSVKKRGILPREPKRRKVEGKGGGGKEGFEGGETDQGGGETVPILFKKGINIETEEALTYKDKGKKSSRKVPK